MGNCLKQGSSMECSKDKEWDLEETRDVLQANNNRSVVAKDHGALSGMGDTSYTSMKDSSHHYKNSKNITEIKIKISRKQLEDLLVQELSASQVLNQLIKVYNTRESTHHRRWRPALESIQEMN